MASAALEKLAEGCPDLEELVLGQCGQGLMGFDPVPGLEKLAESAAKKLIKLDLSFNQPGRSKPCDST